MTEKIPDEVIKQALAQAAWDKRKSLTQYRIAIETAHQHGWGHTRIARVCGVSEAAIRNYLRRSKSKAKGRR